MALLTHLRQNKLLYGGQLMTEMERALRDTSPERQLSSIEDAAELLKKTHATEQEGAKGYVLTYLPSNAEASPEEVVLRVQGYVVNSNLPPVRMNTIPRNVSRLINLKQSITLSGLGTETFNSAVKGVLIIYQAFQSVLGVRNAHLRAWTPIREADDFVLTFGNRYLTRGQDAGNEAPVDLAETVDPFNILRPLLRSEVHILDNVVEYWQRGTTPSGWTSFSRIQPDTIAVTHLVELQVSFTVVKVARNEYAFVPRLRAICLLSREVEKDHNARIVNALLSTPRSPMKKTKRKVGYSNEAEDQRSGDLGMKRLRIDDVDEVPGEDRDQPMH